MNEFVKADLYRYLGKTDFKTFMYCLIRIPGFRFMFLVRKCNQLHKYNPLRWVYFLLYVHFAFKYGFQIPLGTNIGKGFYICHFGTVVMNRNTVIGQNCNIIHNVTFGQTNKGAKKGAPTLGNKVWVGTGAVIVGGIFIGNNVLIAPNAYVNMDVPANCLVIGNPAQIIQKTAAIVDDYIENYDWDLQKRK